MRPLSLLLAVALLAGCAPNGPDVRVVAAVELPQDAAPTTVPADATPPRPPAPVRDEPLRPADDRPGALRTVSMPDTVAVVGDSLTVAATEEITAALARLGIRSVIVDGRESRRMATGSGGLPSGVAAIESILADHEPDLWVVALGTNDVGAAAGPDRFVADLRATLGSVPRTAPVVWVDVWIRDRLPDVVVANEMLRAEVTRRAAPSVVVDWFSAGQLDGLITGDGIHLTEAGQVRFASAIADAVLTLSGRPDDQLDQRD